MIEINLIYFSLFLIVRNIFYDLYKIFPLEYLEIQSLPFSSEISVIEFKFIHVEPLDETSTMSTEQVRQDTFIRALEMVNLIISRNPEILAYY
jgi:hypothetical protein